MKRVSLIALLALFSGLLAGCGETKPAAAKEKEISAISVQTGEVSAVGQTRVQPVAGTVLPRMRAVIEAKTRGRITSMPVRLGQRVKQGELLAELDDHEIQARVEQTLAVRERAEADLKRLTKLLNQKALTQAEFDAAQSDFRRADAALREVQTLLADTRVTAPFDGVVAKKLAEAGDLAAPGKPLIEFDDVSEVRFVADLPEKLFGRISIGAELPIHLPVLDRQIVGTVAEIAPASDPYSRSFRVELDVAGENARPGMFGRLLAPAGQELILLVPRSAVVNRGQLELAFVIRTNQAELRLVRTGREFAESVEILSGLAPGERVVSENAAALRDGQPVVIAQ